jgi:hypothetical protein
VLAWAGLFSLTDEALELAVSLRPFIVFFTFVRFFDEWWEIFQRVFINKIIIILYSVARVSQQR